MYCTLEIGALLILIKLSSLAFLRNVKNIMKLIVSWLISKGNNISISIFKFIWKCCLRLWDYFQCQKRWNLAFRTFPSLKEMGIYWEKVSNKYFFVSVHEKEESWLFMFSFSLLRGHWLLTRWESSSYLVFGHTCSNAGRSQSYWLALFLFWRKLQNFVVKQVHIAYSPIIYNIAIL